MDNVTLNAGEHVIATANPKDPNGNPGGVNTAAFIWDTPAASTKIMITPSNDGHTAEIAVAADAPGGVTSVNVRSFNSNGSVVDSQFSISVNGQPAVTLVFTFGTPFVP